MGILLDIDIAGYSLGMERYVRELNQDGAAVVQEQARLLIQHLIKLTPPKTLKQGRDAIRRDIKRAIGRIDVAVIRNKTLREALERGQIGTANAILRRFRKGPFQSMEAIPFSPAAHTSARASRGRVLTLKHKLAIPARETLDYTKKVEKRSGQAKSGWAAGYFAAGGTRLPGWIVKHDYGRFGHVNELELSGKTSDPHIVFTNNANGMDSVPEERIRAAIQARTKAMETHVNRVLKLIAKYLEAPSVNAAQSAFLAKYGASR